MTYDARIAQLEARIAKLEQLGGASPEDQRLDDMLRKIARSVQMTAWLGGLCLKVAPLVVAVWYLGEEALKWLASFLPGAR